MGTCGLPEMYAQSPRVHHVTTIKCLVAVGCLGVVPFVFICGALFVVCSKSDTVIEKK